MITAPNFLLNAELYNQQIEVVVVGAGGTGSAVLGKLAQMHQLLIKLGSQGLRVTLYDDDTVSPSNVGRQAFYPFDVGQNKAVTLITRFNNFCGTQWKAVPQRFTKDTNTFRSLHGKVIFGCVDSVASRKEIHHALQEQCEWIWIDAGNDTHSGNVVMGLHDQKKEKYIPTVYDLFRTQFDTSVEDIRDSCSHEDAIAKQDFGVNDAMSHHATQILWQLIRHGQVNYQGVSVDLREGTTHPIHAESEIWSMYGYEPTDALESA